MGWRFERPAQALAAVVPRRGFVRGVTRSAGIGVIGVPKPARADAALFGSGFAADPPPAAPAPSTRFPLAPPLARDVVLPTSLQDMPLDPRAGFDLPTSRCRATLVPHAGLVGSRGRAELLLPEPRTIGVVASCLNDVWRIEGEPAAARTPRRIRPSSGHDGPGRGRRDERRRSDFAMQTLPPIAAT